jgi:poly(A) polymerase
MLLGVKPKDFDIATNATPEEVKQIFRRSRLVGRRFRIAHVRFGREIIEVSTFRKHYAEHDGEFNVQSEDGLVLSDNVYGTLEDDVFRRDFTINALYYNPQEDTLFDYVEGLKDLANKRLRLIGKPSARFREDPVRILRAARFTAKLDFTPDDELLSAIPDIAELLTAIPPARLFDECCKLFLGGYAENCWQQLTDLELAPILFPTTDPEDPMIALAMRSTDERVAQGKPVTPGYLFAVLLWPDYQSRIHELLSQNNMVEAQHSSSNASLAEQQLTVAIPRRFGQFIKDTWMLQSRLEKRAPKNLKRILGHPKFRAAYDFFVLRSQCGEADPETATWWTEIQKENIQPERHPDDDPGENQDRNKDGNTEHRAEGEEGSTDKPPRKRRRRRRRTRGRGNSPQELNPT